jgi:hypothetical protein
VTLVSVSIGWPISTLVQSVTRRSRLSEYQGRRFTRLRPLLAELPPMERVSRRRRYGHMRGLPPFTGTCLHLPAHQRWLLAVSFHQRRSPCPPNAVRGREFQTDSSVSCRTSLKPMNHQVMLLCDVYAVCLPCQRIGIKQKKAGDTRRHLSGRSRPLPRSLSL